MEPPDNPLLPSDPGPDDPVEVDVNVLPLLKRIVAWIRKKARDEKEMKMLIAVLVLCPALAFANQVNHALTPGEIDPTVTKEMICKPGFAKSRRNVPESVKEAVYKEYGITSHKPGDYEIDHLVSLELGGTNSIKNLWPQSYKELPGAHQKDAVENRLHWMVCHDKMTLGLAQRVIQENWIGYYEKNIKK